MKKLDKDTTEKIRSNYTISDIQQVMEELVLNSVDANSTSIDVFVDLKNYSITVHDDGLGINIDDFKHIGNHFSR